MTSEIRELQQHWLQPSLWTQALLMGQEGTAATAHEEAGHASAAEAEAVRTAAEQAAREEASRKAADAAQQADSSRAAGSADGAQPNALDAAPQAAPKAVKIEGIFTNAFDLKMCAC